jgi:pyruvate dehydrogenase E1 component beta subunit
MARLTMVQALNLALRQEMASDQDVVVLGEDVGIDGGVFRVTEGLYEQFGADRVIDTPLAEAGIVGTSIGMAWRCTASSRCARSSFWGSSIRRSIS